MNAKCNWPRYSDNKVIQIKVNIKRDWVETCCIAESIFTSLALHLETQTIWARPAAKIKPESFIIFVHCTQFVRVLLPNMSFNSFLLSPFYSATWRIKRLHLLHPCVCPSVVENNTTQSFLVRPASYGGGQGSPAILRPHQLAVPCWSQWDMPAIQGTGVKCFVEMC